MIDLFDHVFYVEPGSSQQKILNQPKPAALKIDKKTERHISGITYDVQQREKKVLEKKKNTPAVEFMDASRTTEHIEKEITDTLSKKRWNGLDTCFKWKLIENYIQENSIKLEHDKLNILKQAVRKNLLSNVSYDKDNHKINRLNFDVGNLVL